MPGHWQIPLVGRGLEIVSGGTDTHLMLVDLRPKNLTGRAAEESLEKADITCNKNGIPFDSEKPTVTSGIRLGTPAATTRGFSEREFRRCGRAYRRCARRIERESGGQPSGGEGGKGSGGRALQRISYLFLLTREVEVTCDALCPFCGNDETQGKGFPTHR